MSFFSQHPLVSLAIFVGASGLLCTSCVSSDSKYPTAAYAVAQTDGAFEVRSYPQLAVVRTSSESDDGSFMRLFRYIGGANATQEKISMTTPVFMEKGTMNFVLPDDKKAHPPKPTQDNVQLTTLPARRVATYRFSGFTSRKSEATALARLKTWLLSQKISFRDEPTYAYYNSPFTLPHLRRNEVHLPLEP